MLVKFPTALPGKVSSLKSSALQLVASEHEITATYLKRVLIAEIKHEHVRRRAAQPVITEVRPFQMRADREVWNCRQIGDL